MEPKFAQLRRPREVMPDCTVKLSLPSSSKGPLDYASTHSGFTPHVAYGQPRLGRLRCSLRNALLLMMTMLVALSVLLFWHELHMGDVHSDPRAAVRRPGASQQAALPPIDWHHLPNTAPWNRSQWAGPPPVNPDDPAWEGSVAICSIMKDEHHDDVEEWLAYHRWIGVKQVFLRENGMEVPLRLRSRLQPFIDSGFLSLDWLPGRKHPLQNRWYNRCSKPDMAGRASWVAFIDLDEFIVVLDNGKASKSPNVKDVLATFKGHAGVSIQWVLFGSSGHIERPTPGGPLQHYSKCTGELSYQMKCVANTFWSAEIMMVGDTVHDCTYRMGEDGEVMSRHVVLADGTAAAMFENTHMTNPEGAPELGRTRTYIGHLNATLYQHASAIRPEHKLAIFHYVTRSLQDYAGRKVKLLSGIYTHRFVASHKKLHHEYMDPDAFAAFEKENKFDGEHVICASAVEAHYAESVSSALQTLL